MAHLTPSKLSETTGDAAGTVSTQPGILSDREAMHYDAPTQITQTAASTQQGPAATTGGDDFGVTIATAGTAIVGGSVTGDIETAQDQDWFAVTLEAGAIYQFDLSGSDTSNGTNPDPHLKGVYDSTGTLLPSSSDDQGGPGNDSLLVFTAPASETYYISAGAFFNNTGTYTLTISDPIVDDFGQTTADAGTIELGVPVQANLHTATDVDWLGVEFEAGTTYVIDIEGSDTGKGTLIDPMLVGLYNAAGSFISGTDDDDSGTFRNAKLVYTATDTGTHYIATDALSNRTGSYTVAVTEFETPDLVAQNVTVSNAAPAFGESITVNYEIANIGDGPAAAGTTAIYISSDAMITSDDALFSEVASGVIAGSGGVEAESASRALSVFLEPGTYYIGVIADDGADNEEVSETNNTSAPVQITVPVPPVSLYDENGDFVQGSATIAGAAIAALAGYRIVVDGATYSVPNGDPLEIIELNNEDVTFDLPTGVRVNATLSDGSAIKLTGAGDGSVIFEGNDNNNRLTGTNGNDELFGSAGNDTLKGLDGDDFIVGDDVFGFVIAGDDFVSGRGGNDTIEGRGGNDLLFGGTDNDSILGGEGHDSLYGGTGTDTISGDAGDDVLVGQDGNDTLDGGAGADNIVGGGGADIMIGGTENDTLAGQAGNDTIDGGDGNDQITGKFGDDSIDGGAGADNIFAGAENDTVNGGAGNDTIRGEGQDDLLNGDAGNDTMTGGGGRDTMNGGDDDDRMFGQGGLDEINGDAGNDELFGSDGNDLLFGGTGNDSLFGGNNNDRLDGGTGSDELSGNAGADVFIFADGYDDDDIISFDAAEDTIELNANLLNGTGLTTVAEVIDTSNGIATQVDASTISLDFGGGDVLLIGSAAPLTLTDLGDTMSIV